MINKNMIRICLSAGLVVFFASSVMAGPLHPGDTVAICGDSITEQKMYSVFIEDYLLMSQPVRNITSHQFGWSGESAPGFLARIESDVLPFQPTVATTLYGMNDGGYSASNPQTDAAFFNNTVAFIKKLQNGGVRYILVGSPGAVDSETFKTWRLAHCSPEAYNQTLANLGKAARRAAEQTGVSFVDVHSVMLAAMEKAKAKYGVDYPMATDGVHPSFNGHLVMAYAFLKALGCDGNIGTIMLDAKTGKATGTEGHRILSASLGEVEIESVRYPFCFVDDPTNRLSTRAMLDCVSFNEDLNRFKLVVKNLPTARATVKWGKVKKGFTAEQLAVGINLAAEFPDNPFSEPFAKVEAAVKAQQAFETPGTKVYLHSLPAWSVHHADEKDLLNELQSVVVEKSEKLAATARSEFKPIRHTLEIIPKP